MHGFHPWGLYYARGRKMAAMMPLKLSAAIPVQFDMDYTKGLQKALNEKQGPSPSLKPDGNFGPLSIAALTAFQTKQGIPASGQYDSASQILLDSFIVDKYLQTKDFVAAGQQLHVSQSIVRTVCTVETSGAGFLSDGRCTILFERHKFYGYLLAKYGQAQVNTLMAQGNSDICNPSPGGYAGGAGEYPRFNRAMAIDQNCAMMSASWGLFQIMGENFNFCGFNDVAAFVNAMRQSEDLQLTAFVAFCQKYVHGQLQTALQQKAWATFARLYNGPNFAANQYDTKMASNYTSIASVYGL
jgi:peptidoglycan hydrolase-like protein with peptidoglycan-binding domain